MTVVTVVTHATVVTNVIVAVVAVGTDVIVVVTVVTVVDREQGFSKNLEISRKGEWASPDPFSLKFSIVLKT